MEIRQYQKSTDLLLRKLPFARLVSLRLSIHRIFVNCRVNCELMMV